MADIRTALRKVLAELDNEEAEERLQKLEGRKFTAADIAHALRGASDAEKDDLRDALIESGIGEEQADRIVGETPEPKPDEPKPDDEPAPAPAKTRTRPGRRAGNAYLFSVDDKGEVRKSDTAIVYSGPDEPDEVELPG